MMVTDVAVGDGVEITGGRRPANRIRNANYCSYYGYHPSAVSTLIQGSFATYIIHTIIISSELLLINQAHLLQ